MNNLWILWNLSFPFTIVLYDESELNSIIFTCFEGSVDYGENGTKNKSKNSSGRSFFTQGNISIRFLIGPIYYSFMGQCLLLIRRSFLMIKGGKVYAYA
jgi:hypothetical protein